jgi:hypothetical protein
MKTQLRIGSMIEGIHGTRSERLQGDTIHLSRGGSGYAYRMSFLVAEGEQARPEDVGHVQLIHQEHLEPTWSQQRRRRRQRLAVAISNARPMQREAIPDLYPRQPPEPATPLTGPAMAISNQFIAPFAGQNNDNTPTHIHDTKCPNAVTHAATATTCVATKRTFIEDFHCAICLELMVRATVLHPCGHVYCCNCLRQHQTRVCPVCRQPMISATRIRTLDQALMHLLKHSPHLFTVDDRLEYMQRTGVVVNVERATPTQTASTAATVHHQSSPSITTTNSNSSEDYCPANDIVVIGDNNLSYNGPSTNFFRAIACYSL